VGAWICVRNHLGKGTAWTEFEKDARSGFHASFETIRPMDGVRDLFGQLVQADWNVKNWSPIGPAEESHTGVEFRLRWNLIQQFTKLGGSSSQARGVGGHVPPATSILKNNCTLAATWHLALPSS
jgi:hypothetical protein